MAPLGPQAAGCRARLVRHCLGVARLHYRAAGVRISASIILVLRVVDALLHLSSSFVVEIKASEIVRGGKSIPLTVPPNSADHVPDLDSDDYGAGLTLRFPRESASTASDRAASDQFRDYRREEAQPERSRECHGLQE